uniref:C3H1-type domain-containing protein n=1 Tax=Panagrellus redivivus TaxID=6233 RepID=A0A7E4ZW89_PANRE
MPSPGQSSRSGKYTSTPSQSTISSPSPKCPLSTFGDSAFSGSSNDGSRLYAINQQHSYLESMLTKHNVRNVRNAPQPESMALFNDAFLNHLSLKDYPKRPNPTEYAFHSAAPQVPSFSSVPAAYDYINPMIRSVNAPGSGSAPEASSTSSASTKSRETPPPLLASSRMSAFTDQENVAPAAAPPVADLSQYINPEIHSAHPAFRNPSGLAKNGRKEPRPDTFKTVMCQAWLESTYCAFGAECKFAHGEGELRPAVLPIRNSQKYKTKLCDKYTTTGICPYGRRCLFIHPDPASSEAYRRHVVAQTLVQNTIGLPLKSSAPEPPATPVTAAPTTPSPDPTESDSGLTTPFSSRPHPSWPLESPTFFNRYPNRPIGAWRAAMKTGLESESVKEAIREQNASMQPTQENHQREAIRMAARAAAAAAHQTGAPLGMTEEDLAEHLALQLIELQRTQSSSSAFGHLVDEQTSRLHQTHSLPNSRHSSISPFSNASTGSTSGIWSNTQSPEDVFTDNVFYHEDNDHQTPKFTAPSVIRRPKKSTTPVDPDEVSVEISTPSADMFKNLARTLNL